MGRKERILIGVAVAVGIADALAAHSVYVRKKAVTMRDMALKSIDEALRKKPEHEEQAGNIPIE